MNERVLELQNISRIYPQGDKRLTVLYHLHLAMDAGETVALVGPSGSGKTTLLQIAGLLDAPTEGSVFIGGQEATGASDRQRTRLRLGHIGFVYQFHHLLPEFSALENVMLPQVIAGVTKGQASRKAAELLDRLGLAERLGHRPARLSGGEQQRVAIARALANDPVLLLADEPTGNLDIHTADAVFALLMEVVREKKLAALVATHNPDLARRMSRTVRLEDGALNN